MPSRPVSKAASWVGQAADTVAVVPSLAIRAVSPGFDMARDQHPRALVRWGDKPAEDASSSAVGEHSGCEDVLADSDGADQDALSLRRVTLAMLLAPATQTLLEISFDVGPLELLLADQGELAVVLEAEEVGQRVDADALTPRRREERSIDVGEVSRIFAKSGAGDLVPARPMRA